MTTIPANDPTQLSVRELIALYARKALSPVDVVQATLTRIERMNPLVNAYCHLDADGALAAAGAAEARWLAGVPRGLVDGVPLGVKDNIAVAGMPLRFGSRLTGEAPVTFDAPVVARLREQGAIVIGKTAMPEFGWKATSDSPLTGSTRNPWDTRMTTGGSWRVRRRRQCWGWAPCSLVPTAAARSEFPPPLPAATASSPRAHGCPPSRPLRSAPWRTTDR